METFIIIAVVAAVLGLGYLILRKPKADVVLVGSNGSAQDLANSKLQQHLKHIGRERGVRRHNGRYVYADDGSFIEDLILLDILMDGELDFNFIPEYDEVSEEAFNAVSEALDAIPVAPEQTWEKEDDLDVRDTPEVAVSEPVYSAPEPTRSYGGGSDSGGYDSGGDSGGGDSGGSDD
jgi:hypothetical protein